MAGRAIPGNSSPTLLQVPVCTDSRLWHYSQASAVWYGQGGVALYVLHYASIITALNDVVGGRSC